MKQTFSTANTFEKLFGYKRAVRKGNLIFVSGTTSLDPESGSILHTGNAFLQAQAAFDEALRAVRKLGGAKSDVVRVRMFVKDKNDTGAVGEAFSKVFGQDQDPAVATTATMVIAEFVDPAMLVEIELDAVLD